MREVTDEAKQQALHARSSAKVEILVLDGRDIEDFLGSMKTVKDFLVEKHRAQTVLRTF